MGSGWSGAARYEALCAKICQNQKLVTCPGPKSHWFHPKLWQKLSFVMNSQITTKKGTSGKKLKRKTTLAEKLLPTSNSKAKELVRM